MYEEREIECKISKDNKTESDVDPVKNAIH